MKIEFKKIDRTNYWDCMALAVAPEQTHFVADNRQSLVEAAYEDGLHPMGIYCDGILVGFLLYDYDASIPGWSLSRFMIGRQYQGKGYGTQAAAAFLSYFQEEQHADRIYISVSLDNIAARKMYAGLGFRELKEVEYTFQGARYQEMQMVKQF